MQKIKKSIFTKRGIIRQKLPNLSNKKNNMADWAENMLLRFQMPRL